MDGEITIIFDTFKILCKDRTTKDVVASYGVISYKSKPAILGIIHGLDDRRKAVNMERNFIGPLSTDVPLSEEDLKVMKSLRTLFNELVKQEKSKNRRV